MTKEEFMRNVERRGLTNAKTTISLPNNLGSWSSNAEETMFEQFLSIYLIKHKESYRNAKLIYGRILFTNERFRRLQDGEAGIVELYKIEFQTVLEEMWEEFLKLYPGKERYLVENFGENYV